MCHKINGSIPPCKVVAIETKPRIRECVPKVSNSQFERACYVLPSSIEKLLNAILFFLNFIGYIF